MITRRKALGLVAATAASGAASAFGQDSFPSDTLKFVCAFPPGSGADVIVRHFAEKIRPLAGKNKIGRAHV